MTPDYEADGITLYAGDALRVLAELPDDSVDAIITDPPYSSGGMTRSDRIASTGDKYVGGDNPHRRPDFSGDNRDQRSFVLWATLWLGECLRVLKPGRAALVFSDWRQVPVMTDAIQIGGFVWRGLVSWDKVTTRPRQGFSAQAEFVVWGTKGPLDLGHEVYLPGVIRQPFTHNERRHQTPKPVHLMEQLVAIVPRGGTVLDPFAGSGTTLVAAKRHGRNAIGVELDEGYRREIVARLGE